MSLQEGGCPHALDLQLLGGKRSRESMNASEPVQKLVKQWHEEGPFVGRGGGGRFFHGEKLVGEGLGDFFGDDEQKSIEVGYL